MLLRSSALAGSLPSARPSQRRRSLAVHANASTKEGLKVGFRWDGANLRWVRDDRLAGADAEQMVIKPKSGAAYMAWPVVHTCLKEYGLRSVAPSEAAELQKDGWALVDVRLAGDFVAETATGAVSLPLYRYVEGDALYDNLKRLACAGMGMKATERNLRFAAEAVEQLGEGRKIIVMCDIGGTLDTIVSYRREKKLFADPERQFGRESRSLKAAYELLEAGWRADNILHLEGGLQLWRHQDYPTSWTD